MRREQFIRRVICIGLTILALQFAFMGFVPTTAIADGGGGVTPPEPADTTGISKSQIVDTTGTFITDPTMSTSISFMDLLILTAQAIL